MILANRCRMTLLGLVVAGAATSLDISTSRARAGELASSQSAYTETQARRVMGRRPFDPFRHKTLYLSSYAGTNYPSAAPRATLAPTGVAYPTSRSSRPFFGWFGTNR
ncbi:hypothetical protein ACYOEI_17010 [Singulisphaera rosea]